MSSFLRRASSPGESEEQVHPLRPARFNNNSRMVSFRPARFIKANTPAASPPDTLSDDMKSFVQTFDNYNQKVYIEGYLFRHNTNESSRTRCFAELCGSNLSMWDAEVQQQRVMPQYTNISDCVVEQQDKRMFVLTTSKRKTIHLEASDEQTMLRWICALRLACFEKQKLHMLFTQKLLLQHFDPAADIHHHHKWEAQVCHQGDWHKQWIVIDHPEQQQRKLFQSKSVPEGDAQLQVLESRKSKTPTLVMTDITHAYAIYPELPQLIDKSCIMRIDGMMLRKGEKSPEQGHILLMTDQCQQMAAGLLAIFDAYRLHGRPQQLVTDPTNQQALNYGDSGSLRLFLETDDVLSFMDRKENMFIEALHKKLSEPIRPPGGVRANSLPLITVACEDGTASIASATTSLPLRHRSVSDGMMYDSDDDDDLPRSNSRRPSKDARYKFARQVADSSDESEEEDDEEDEDEEEVDSDDEPIAKTKSQLASRAGSTAGLGSKSAAESLIPDFDFGNGFDVSRSPGGQSSASSLLETPQATDEAVRSRQGSVASAKEQPAPSSSSLFGDFSLSMDFGKYMDKSGDRKYSLPANVKLSERESVDRQSSSGAASSASSYFGHLSPSDYARRRRSSWDHQQHGWDDYDDDDSYYGKRSMDRRHPYDVDHDGYECEGAPMIPSLSDHFAPQNSLLDTYLGEQLTAKEQIQYCRATGQPLIQVEQTKPRVPEGGFVGMISRREKDRKEGNNLRVNERVQQHHADRSMIEREKERRLFEQRQQQWMKHHQQQQMMMYNNGYMPGPPPPPGMPLMYPPPPMHPYMGAPPPPLALGSPLTPPSPMSPGPYMMSPGGYMPAQGLRPTGPRSPSMSSPASPSSRRSSRPLLDDAEDDSPVMMARYRPAFRSRE
ncbi:hypothetical protein BJV82DRAFT_631860 [Fennellomyces sp. T-0311]|nr:hypothetical protein BJV82DRAFT_631860 [Fennellomyces sp. T-0311]